ncbi:MAG: glycosyltransferase involved in cell wall biosynthesis [Psychroserpens sp.]|jgi:glycosyltransferase involved in cell wall biosynthesis
MKVLPIFSIVTACYNAEETIQETIESVLSQTITCFEFIIIDGASTDGTLEIVKSFEEKFLAKGIPYSYLTEPDKGIYDAWNKGVNLAKGSYISFLGADDTYLINSLNLYNEILINEKETNYHLLYSNVDVIDSKGEIVKKIKGTWTWSVFRRYMNIAHVGSFHSRAYFDKYGLFNDQFKIAGDYELLLRAKDELRAYKLEQVTVKMKDGGVSRSQLKNTLNETFTAKNSSGGVSYVVCLFDHLVAYSKVFVKRII